MLEKVYEAVRENYKGTELVFGEGAGNARIMLVGEAPGKDEIANKRPFCGRAGKNLDEFLDVVGLKRKEIFISNVCKFRPVRISEKGTVSNRPPDRGEITEALPFLYSEIAAVGPELIVTLGNTPLRACFNDFGKNIGELHGRLTKVCIAGSEFGLFPLYHPASIIYNRSLAPIYRDDLYKLRTILDN